MINKYVKHLVSNLPDYVTKTSKPIVMDIVLDAGYNGYVGIEYEGSVHSEMEGIRLTNELLKKIRDSFS